MGAYHTHRWALKEASKPVRSSVLATVQAPWRLGLPSSATDQASPSTLIEAA
jgi:hypothetical protein